MASKAGRTGLDVAQGALSALAESVGRLNKPAIGPLLTNLSGEQLADAVVASRLTKHLIGGKGLSDAALADQTIQKMLDHDTYGLQVFNYRALPHRERRNFLLAKEKLVSFAKRVKRRNAFRFPSGETALSSGGETDIIAKLASNSQWRVSFEASHDASSILYQTQALRRVVKERFKTLYPHWKFLADAWHAEHKSGYQVFHRMFVACCHIQNYSRLSTVEKNSHSRRPISMEPMFNMMVQLSFAQDLRAALLEHYGINLDTLADLHRGLIRHENKATIDLRNASNSNWMCVIRELWPRSVVKILERMRTPVCYYKGSFHHYNMLAPMGCGFTFEVMTITLLSLARVLDPGATVFGDDIIIDASKADEFLALLNSTGWEVNGDKTFVSGNFRESCGGFHDLTTKSDILSYEFHAIKNWADVCTTANKLRHLIKRGQISSELRNILAEHWVKLALTIPRVAFRAEVDFHTVPLPQGVVIVPDLWYRNVRNDTTMSVCYSHMYHREVTLGARYCIRAVPSLLEFSERIRFACYLRRGVSYTPMLRPSHDDIVTDRVICGGEGLIANNPILSFI